VSGKVKKGKVLDLSLFLPKEAKECRGERVGAGGFSQMFLVS
jgi:hypothetical protein